MTKHRRTKANGRSVAEQFIALPYGMVKSDVWRTLSGNTIKVLLELKSRFNGNNNGKLCLPFADATKKLRLGRATINRAFQELQTKGFIKLAKRGRWYGRMAHEWVITDKPWDGNFPTNEWKHWQVCKTKKTEVGSNAEHLKP